MDIFRRKIEKTNVNQEVSEEKSPLGGFNPLRADINTVATGSEPIAKQQILKQTQKSKIYSKSDFNNKSLFRPEGHNFPGHTHNPLSPFLYHPDRANFLNKENEEKVILIVRKHPITNLKWMLTAIFMMFMPLFFSFASFFSALSIDYRLILSIIWYMIVFAFVFEEFLMWFFHVNIVTDERIIEVDFINIFHREMTDANIDQIQDVTVELGGGLRTFFNYGNVIIQTAAEVPRITFECVPKPDKVAKILREMRVEEEQEKLEGRVR